ncbi:hypothetical protein ACFLYT_01685, partial [Nanoarchaeota archaeon]
MTQITTFQELKSSIQAMQSAKKDIVLNPGDFTSAKIKRVFEMLPEMAEISYPSDSKVDLDNNSLVITGSVSFLDMGTLTLTSTFTLASGNQLLLTLSAELVDNLTFSDSINFHIEKGFLNLVTKDSSDLVYFELSGDLVAGGLRIPVALEIPPYNGNWMLSSNFEKIGGLNFADLAKIANVDLSTYLPSELGDILKLSLSDIELVFNPIARTFSKVYLEFSYDTVISLSKDFTFSNFKLCLTVAGLNEISVTLEADVNLSGAVIGLEADIPVSSKFYELVFTGLLKEGTLNISGMAQTIGLALPDSFPLFEITELSACLDLGSKTFDFGVGMGNPIDLLPDFTLNSIMGSLQVDFGSNPSFSGNLTTSLTWDGVSVGFSGTVTDKGFIIAGDLGLKNPVHLITLIDKMLPKDVQIPEDILSVEIEGGDIVFDTTQSLVNFSLNSKAKLDFGFGELSMTSVAVNFVKGQSFSINLSG